MKMVGHLDMMGGGRILGWARYPDHPHRRTEVFAWIDGRFHGRYLANEHRSDLEKAGIGDGRHAFGIPVPRRLVDGRAHEVRITTAQGQELAGSPAAMRFTDCAQYVLPTDRPADSDQVTMLAVAKNEGPYIEEWVAHHYAIGFRRFLVYDNDSTDGTGEMLARNPRLRGIVQVVPWPASAYADAGSPQIPAYQDGLRRLGRRGWVAILDIDEFLVPRHDATVQALLARYRDVSALSIGWKLFGSSGLASYDEGRVTERFRYAGPSRMTKTIARLEHIEAPAIHCPIMRERPAVDELRRPNYALNHLQTPTHASVQINHYFSKSMGEWEEKRFRGRSDRTAADAGFVRPPGDFDRHDLAQEFDLSIHRFAAATRAALRELFPDHARSRRIARERQVAAHQEVKIRLAAMASPEAVAAT